MVFWREALVDAASVVVEAWWHPGSPRVLGVVGLVVALAAAAGLLGR